MPLEAAKADDSESLAQGTVLTAKGVRMSVRRLPDEGSVFADLLQRSNAELVFELERGLTVGYRGFYRCHA